MELSFSLNKKVVLTVWVVFSILYVAYDVYAQTRFGLMQNAYTQGKTETVAALIQEASNKECKSFTVYAGENKVELVNVACLKQGSGESAPAAAPAAK